MTTSMLIALTTLYPLLTGHPRLFTMSNRIRNKNLLRVNGATGQVHKLR